MRNKGIVERIRTHLGINKGKRETEGGKEGD
jgi:hypothetical protein